LAAAAIWAGAALLAPQALRPVALLPLAGTLVVPAVAAAHLIGESVTALVSVGAPFSQHFDVLIASAPTEVSPLLLTPALLVIALAGCAVGSLVEPVGRSTWVVALGGALVAGAPLPLPLYDVPLTVIVGILLVAAGGGFVVAGRLPAATAD